jgi:hypothetical protein
MLDAVVGAVVGAVVTGGLAAAGYFYKRRQDQRAAVAKEERDRVEAFYKTAYELQNSLRKVAKIIKSRAASDITDQDRKTHLDDLINKAWAVRNFWDPVTGSVDSSELRGALDGVNGTVQSDIIPPLSEGNLTPDLASLGHSLEKYREVANRRIGTRF